MALLKPKLLHLVIAITWFYYFLRLKKHIDLLMQAELVCFNRPLKQFKALVRNVKKISVGQLYLLSYFVKLKFSLIIKFRVLLCLNTWINQVTCHVITLLKFSKLMNWWRIWIALIKKWAFTNQILIIHLGRFRMIFLHFIFRAYEWPKNRILTLQNLLCEKGDGHSKSEGMEIIDLHLKPGVVGLYY